jgi:hypothetical protein
MRACLAGTAIVAALTAVSVGAGALHAPSRGTAPRPHTLVVTHGAIVAFAQNGAEIAWVEKPRQARRCTHRLHFWPVRAGYPEGVRIGCGHYPDFALAGHAVLWKNSVGGGNLERDLEVMTIAAGDQRPRRVEHVHIELDPGSGYPELDTLLGGAGDLLVYSVPHGIRRVVAGRRRSLFGFEGALALGVDRGRILTVGQVLRPGDGCGCNTSPRWSPDGSRIALLNGVGRQNVKPAEITVMNADGSGRTVLTNDHRLRLALDWSPDGTRFAYSYVSPSAGAVVIAVAASNGSGSSDLVRGDDPAWSPDGTKIAFDRGSQVFVMGSDGTGVHALATGGRPAWSPNGAEIAYQPGPSAMAADGSNQRLVGPGDGFDADWSPDGQRLAFARAGAAKGIWEVDADGGNLRRLTYGPDEQPRWSLDGHSIVFASASNDVLADEETQLELYAMNADGTGLHPLTFSQRASWAAPAQIRSASGRLLSSFEASGTVVGGAIGGGRVAILTRTLGAGEFSVFAAGTGARLLGGADVGAAKGLALAGVNGRWVVYRTNRTIRGLNAFGSGVSRLTVASSEPVGLSVSGRRVAWAERGRSVWRIRALTLPR